MTLCDVPTQIQICHCAAISSLFQYNNILSCGGTMLIYTTYDMMTYGTALPDPHREIPKPYFHVGG